MTAMPESRTPRPFSMHWGDGQIVEEAPTERGGFDKVVFEVHGHGAYSQLKFEGGVHRVQRVPKTEAQGRIHTSAATVAVMPEADPVEVELKPEDIEIKTSPSQGPGGQSVNTTYSAIRITHKPTGMTVSIQDEKSQLQNKEKALRVLRARLYEIKLAEQQAAIGAQRRGMVGTGSRSEKVRTYNFKENRVTDHRIKLTVHQLDRILQGIEKHKIDLVVMGTHGRTGLSHLLIGSVAERVVRKCPCAVLTVRQPGRKFKHPAER